MRRAAEHQALSVRRWYLRQGIVQCFGVSNPGGLQDGGLGVQSLQFGIDKLKIRQLRFGGFSQLLHGVFFVVNFYGAHGCFLSSYKPRLGQFCAGVSLNHRDQAGLPARIRLAPGVNLMTGPAVCVKSKPSGKEKPAPLRGAGFKGLASTNAKY